MPETVTDIYTDGGVCGRNPSPLGGSWAWVQVDIHGARLRHESGFITPQEAGMDTVSSNFTELLAAVCALEALPDGWAGKIHTDSKVTYWRVLRTKRQCSLKNIPQWLGSRLAAEKGRLGAYTVHLVKGHPTPLQIMRGRCGNGKAVSHHNVFVDSLCCQEIEARCAV